MSPRMDHPRNFTKPFAKDVDCPPRRAKHSLLLIVRKRVHTAALIFLTLRRRLRINFITSSPSNPGFLNNPIIFNLS